MACWYVAKGTELLIDLDDPTRLVRGGTWLEMFFRRRLRDAVRNRKLPFKQLWLSESNTPGHLHAAILLTRALPLVERLVWQMHLGSDLYRARADLMRACRNNKAATLLIRKVPFVNYYRDPDHVCLCRAKHDTVSQFALGKDACKVWRKLRGATPWELFGRPPGEGFREPDGSLPQPVADGIVPRRWLMSVHGELTPAVDRKESGE